MHDFPPVVPGRPVRPSGQRRRGLPARDFSDPDVRTPRRFLAWLMWQQAPALFWSSVMAVLEFLPGAIGPLLVGRIVDRGIVPQDGEEVVELSLILLGLIVAGVLGGVLRHTLIVRTWLVAMFGTMKLVNRQSTELGHVLGRRAPTGEVLSVSAGDSNEFGAITEVGTRAVGALVAYAAVAAIVLSTSIRLGLVILVAAPLLVGLALPLLRPLQRRQEIERARSAELTSQATDIVAGLRILRGIGGERTFAQNYAAQSQRTKQAGLAAGYWQAGLEAVALVLSGLFLVALTWLGAREVAAGALSIGQLISFFGYAVFMIWPIQTCYEFAEKWVRCLVSARRATALLAERPPWSTPDAPVTLPGAAPLTDHRSGFVAQPGRLTAVVSARPDDAAALADRLGRYLPAEQDVPGLDADRSLKGRAARRAREARRAERERRAREDAELGAQSWGVSVGPVDLADAELSEVRRHILVNDRGSAPFAGSLQALIDPLGQLTREEAERALHTAAAEDVFEALPGGWQGRIDERGRGLSGGQRQRLVLARALAADPEILVLVEPTSAVDAHTEALIAERLAEHRRGRTTVVVTGSPLLLHHAEDVALLADGRIVEQGRHDQLLARSAAYRRVVVRNLDGPDGFEQADPSPTARDQVGVGT